MAEDIALFLVVNPQKVTGLFLEGLVPVFPGTLHRVFLIPFQEGNQAVDILLIADAPFTDEIPVVHNSIPTALLL
jgi:hypothetical protein